MQQTRQNEVLHGKWLMVVIDKMLAGYHDGEFWDDGEHRAGAVGMEAGLRCALKATPRPYGDATEVSSALASLKSGAWVCDCMKTPWINALSFLSSIRQTMEISIQGKRVLPLCTAFEEDAITGHLAIDAEIAWANSEIQIAKRLHRDVSPFTDYITVLDQLRSLADNGVLGNYLAAVDNKLVDGRLPAA